MLGLERKRLLLSGYHLTIFGAFLFGVDSISEEVAGFSPLWFPKGKYLFYCLMCLIVVLVILSVKDPNNVSLMLKI